MPELEIRAPVDCSCAIPASAFVQSGTEDGRSAAGMEVALGEVGMLAHGDAMSIAGVITTKDVLRHSATIVREFGPAAYLRCCVAILFRRRTTFLNCVCELRQEL
jgi:hypothetical protein